MVESLVVLLVTCLLLFGLLQVSHAFAGREIMRHAAARAARARAVGFNNWMCEKVMRAAAIPASGKMIAPDDGVPADEALIRAAARRRDGEIKDGALWDWAVESRASSARADFEKARIPGYLACENSARANAHLNYEGWGDISASGLGGGTSSGLVGDVLTVRLKKRHPLSIFVRMLNDWSGFAAGGADGLNALTLRGDFDIEAHYPLYLDDQGW